MGGLNILVVDDSSVMRRMIIRSLDSSGLSISEVHQAANGQEALDLLGQKPFDLAFVDVNMPGMNGEELVEKVRATPAISKLLVIVVSTEGSETRIARLRKHGACFVHKPFNPESIKGLVAGMLGGTHVV
jgi:two-component system chemotaxis response regulator CheY